MKKKTISCKNDFSLENFIDSFLAEHPNFRTFVMDKNPCADLSSCLSELAEPTLQTVSNSLNIKNADSRKKRELIPLLKTAVLEKNPLSLGFASPFFMFLLCLKDTETQKAMFSGVRKMAQDTFDYFLAFALEHGIKNGFIFLVRENDAARIFVPTEVAEKATTLAEDSASEKFVPGDLNDFLLYAETLTLLYGTCDLALFQKIYNRDFPHKKISDKKELQNFCVHASQINNIFTVSISDSLSDSMIVSTWIGSDAILDFLVSGRKDFKSYIPSKKELESKLQAFDYDEDLPSFGELVKLFSNLGSLENCKNSAGCPPRKNSRALHCENSL